MPKPQRWWFAKKEDLWWLTDPDEDEGRRWADRDTRQWAAIAPIVDGVARALSAGKYADADGDATVRVELSALDEADREIVLSWLQLWQAPSADAWSTTSTDGRHRLWNTWHAAPEALLPLYSALLWHADDVDEMPSDHLRSYRDEAAGGLVYLSEEIAARAPGYVQELQRAAVSGRGA